MPIKRQRKSKVVWYAVFTWQGERVWEKAGPDKREAERLEARRRREVKEGTYEPPANRARTVCQWLSDWGAKRANRSADGERGWIRLHIVTDGEFADMRMSDVRPRHTIAFIKRLQARAVLAPKSIALVWGVMSVSFRDAVIAEVIDANPCVAPRGLISRKARREKEIYEAHEVSQMLADERMHPITRIFVALLFYTGMRVGEVCGLTWADVAGDAITVSKQYDGRLLKTDRPRIVPIHPELKLRLQAWETEFFTVNLQRPLPTQPIVPAAVRGSTELAHHTKSSAYKMWLRACRSAGIRNRSIHSTRHTFITLARRGGARLDVVERITHNARGGIVDRYTHWQWEPLAEAVRCFRVDENVDASANDSGKDGSDSRTRTREPCGNVQKTPVTEHGNRKLDGVIFAGGAGVLPRMCRASTFPLPLLALGFAALQMGVLPENFLESRGVA